MSWIRILLFLLFERVAQLFSEDIRSFRMSIISGWYFQCANTTCLPFTTVITSNILKCQTNCLAQTQCQAACFHQLTSHCELFTNTPNQDNNIFAKKDTVTMIVVSDTRIPYIPKPIEETTQQISTASTEQSTFVRTTSTCINTLITPVGRSPTIAWYFENNLNDRFGNYTGIGQNNPTYLLGRNRCGKCLNLSKTLQQSVIISTTPYIDFRSISFSIETWVKPMVVTDGVEHVIFGQCGLLATRQCMRLGSGGAGVLNLAFRSDNHLGSRILPINVWSHFAYVYDMTARTISTYFNGTLDLTSSNHGPYVGAPTFMQIGNINAIGSIYFDGCIDEIFFYPFARNASEIAATAALG